MARYCQSANVFGARAGAVPNPRMRSARLTRATIRLAASAGLRCRSQALRSLLVQRLQRAFGQRGTDCALLDAELDVAGHLDLDEIVFDLRHAADEPARR